MDSNSNNNQETNQQPITPQPNPGQPVNPFQPNDNSNITNNNQETNQQPIITP